jgi:hypothetical protein
LKIIVFVDVCSFSPFLSFSLSLALSSFSLSPHTHYIGRVIEDNEDFDRNPGLTTRREQFHGRIYPIQFHDLKNGSYRGEYIVHDPGTYYVQVGFIVVLLLLFVLVCLRLFFV